MFTRPPSGWQNATETAVLSLRGLARSRQDSAIRWRSPATRSLPEHPITYNNDVTVQSSSTQCRRGDGRTRQRTRLSSPRVTGPRPISSAFRWRYPATRSRPGRLAYTAGTLDRGRCTSSRCQRPDGRAGTQTAELTATDGAVGYNIGQSVAIAGGTIVAGGPGHRVCGQSSGGCTCSRSPCRGGKTPRTPLS